MWKFWKTNKFARQCSDFTKKIGDIVSGIASYEANVTQETVAHVPESGSQLQIVLPTSRIFPTLGYLSLEERPQVVAIVNQALQEKIPGCEMELMPQGHRFSLKINDIAALRVAWPAIAVRVQEIATSVDRGGQIGRS